jgi:hypothetical protein
VLPKGNHSSLVEHTDSTKPLDGTVFDRALRANGEADKPQNATS